MAASSWCYHFTQTELVAAMLAHDTRSILRKIRKQLCDVEAPEKVRRGKAVKLGETTGTTKQDT